MAGWFFRLSLLIVPDRRRSDRPLIWLSLLLVGKYLLMELSCGQTNLLFGVVLLSAALAMRRGWPLAAGVLVGVGVFVKPYALVFVPWLVWVSGAGALAAFSGVVVAGLVLPAAVYGWAGNLDLLAGWYRIVTTSTAHTLLGHENISLASMWGKWWQPEAAPLALTAASSVAVFAMAAAAVVVRRRGRSPEGLEYAVFAFLVPLLSPQGWDYLLLLALPGYMCLVDRWRDMPRPWRVVMIGGLAVTSFAIYDVLRRPLYMFVVNNGVTTLGAIAILACLLRLRWRALA
jgi:hypothetical protein